MRLENCRAEYLLANGQILAAIYKEENFAHKAPKDIDSKRFKALANKHIAYAAQAEQCKQNMVKLFEPVINDIIETNYSSYPEYRNYLHQAGIIGVRLSMDQIYPEPYTHYCQRIIVEMYRFLDENDSLKNSIQTFT